MPIKELNWDWDLNTSAPAFRNSSHHLDVRVRGNTLHLPLQGCGISFQKKWDTWRIFLPVTTQKVKEEAYENDKGRVCYSFCKHVEYYDSVDKQEKWECNNCLSSLYGNAGKKVKSGAVWLVL